MHPRVQYANDVGRNNAKVSRSFITSTKTRVGKLELAVEILIVAFARTVEGITYTLLMYRTPR